jgi:thiamine-phosphate pyrophosphorylase
MLRLPRVYPLTDVGITGLSHAEQVSRLSDGGASLVQLREKKLTPQDFYEQAKVALAIAHSRKVQLIINDRVDLALALQADGVHLGQEDLPPEAARTILGPEAIVGFSTHTLEQARQAATLPIDYLAIGPIFRTATKADTAPEVGLAGLKSVRAAVGNLPLVAIGGITPANAQDVIEAGADSVAMIGALLSSRNIADCTRALLLSLELL